MLSKDGTNNDLQSTHHYSHSSDFQNGIHNNMHIPSISARERRHRQRIRSRLTCCPFERIKYYCAMSVIVTTCLVQSEAFNLPATSFHSHLGSIPSLCMSRKGTNKSTRQSSVKILYFAPAKDPDSYDFDAIEEKIIRGQQSSPRPNNKSIKRRTTKSQKGKRNGGSSLPANPTAKKSSNRKKGRRGSKTLGSASVKMPPWLAQYENEDFASSYYLAKESQSALLVQPDMSINNDMDGACDNENEQNTISQMQRIQLALNGIFYHPSTNNGHPTTNSAKKTSAGNTLPETISYFTPSEIHEVMDAIRVASHGNSNLMAGCADFLFLMLTLEEEGVLTSDFLSTEAWDADDIGIEDYDGWENGASERGGRPEPHSIMTRDVLVAAAFHYCDCVRARKGGIYDYARQAMDASLDIKIWKELEKKKQLWLPPAVEDLGDNDGDALRNNGEQKIRNEDDSQDNATPTAGDEKSIVVHTVKSVARSGTPPIEQYGEESVKIATGAARLKRAEIMASTVNSNSSLISRSNTNQPNDEAEILRSFLVSLSEDWRALVIRSAACLYRLKGISARREYTTNGVGGDGNGKSTRSVVLSTSTINTARDAIRIYAPLAQRLGMQRLKTELENTAFRILYPRQFSVASSLYGDIGEMKSIVQVLSSRIEQLLRNDPVFFDQIEDVTVSSRVKEPYSLWRKMLRYRKEAADAKNKAAESVDAADRQFASSAISMKWVPDSIALRVVLRAMRRSPLEDDESLRTREKMLCYYALQLISDVWPASTHNVAKDYIKNPKPNGYQSLHYTASLVITGEEWPFEVQIRSEEMHRLAEFGVAAHWDYKLQNKVIKSLPGTSEKEPLSHESTPMLALPSEIQPLAVKVNIAKASKVADRPSRVAQKGRIASYIESLTTSRETIVQNNLFVFLSSNDSALDGRIVSIDPAACNVADVLEKYGAAINKDILDDIADGTLEIYQNGVSTSLDEELSNGDVLTLPSIIIEKLSV